MMNLTNYVTRYRVSSVLPAQLPITQTNALFLVSRLNFRIKQKRSNYTIQRLKFMHKRYCEISMAQESYDRVVLQKKVNSLFGVLEPRKYFTRVYWKFRAVQPKKIRIY